MAYLISDIRKLLRKNWLFQAVVLIMLVIMIADPISAYFMNVQYIDGDSDMSLNAFQYWFFLNTSGWGIMIYNVLVFVIPVLAAGMLFVGEERGSALTLLIIRKGRGSYYLAKAAAVGLVTFVIFALLFLLNIAVTYIVFPADAPLTEQYFYRVPKETMFCYSLYCLNPVYEALLYAFLNALKLALYALFVLGVQEIARPKNALAALLLPYAVLRLGSYAANLLLRGHMDINITIVTQPMAASALTAAINAQDVLLAFGSLALVSAALLAVGYWRGREIL
ncbi:MAG: hypothetical protein LUE15_03575 [Oscillospiraceae bacterium]|nr:hypothetical protein [Oscillospiraceae bacterium]